MNRAALAELKDELGAEEHDVVFRSIDELAFTIKTGAVSVYETASHRDLADFGIPVPTTRYLPPRLLASVYSDLADQLGLPFILTALQPPSEAARAGETF